MVSMIISTHFSHGEKNACDVSFGVVGRAGGGGKNAGGQRFVIHRISCQHSPHDLTQRQYHCRARPWRKQASLYMAEVRQNDH
jgi:hypothetical protein